MASLSPDTRPRRRDDVTVMVRDDRTVLRGADGRVHVLNPTAHALWVLADGDTTPREIAAAVCDVFDVSLDAAIDDVTTGLRRLADDGLIDVDGGRAGGSSDPADVAPTGDDAARPDSTSHARSADAAQHD